MRRTLQFGTLALALALAAPPARGQSRAPAGRNDAPPAPAVTFDDVLKLVRQGQDAPAILTACDTVFTLSPVQRDQLRRAGAAPALVDALQRERMPIGDVANFVLILDCSGSMKDAVAAGQSKMDAAKLALADLVAKVPEGRNLSLVIYGHDAAQKCEAVTVVRPLGPLGEGDRRPLAEFVAALQPVGHTPIAKSLQAAGAELGKAEGLSQVVLITDGQETCHGDPAKEAEALAQTLPKLRGVDVIAFGLKPAEKASVAAIAKRGRGKFYDAQSAPDLANAIAAAANVPHVADRPPAEPPKSPAGGGGLTAIDKVFITQLKDKSADVRRAAAEGLAKRKNKAKEVIDALAEAVATDDAAPDGVYETRARDAVLGAFKALAPDRVEAALVKAAKSKTAAVRKWAADRGGELGDGGRPAEGELPAVVQTLVGLLKDKSADVRRAAAEGLAKRKNKAKEVIDALAEAVATDDAAPDGVYETRARDAVLGAFKALAPDRVEAALVKAAESKNAAVREWAAKRLVPE